MTKSSEWEIRVGRKAEVLAEFRVPVAKLPKNALGEFLKALVVRYRTDTPEEMLPYYVSRRAGKPTRMSFTELRNCRDLDRRRIGYCSGNWECYAFAMHEITAEAAQTLKKILGENMAADFPFSGPLA